MPRARIPGYCRFESPSPETERSGCRRPGTGCGKRNGVRDGQVSCHAFRTSGRARSLRESVPASRLRRAPDRRSRSSPQAIPGKRRHLLGSQDHGMRPAATPGQPGLSQPDPGRCRTWRIVTKDAMPPGGTAGREREPESGSPCPGASALAPAGASGGVPTDPGRGSRRRGGACGWKHGRSAHPWTAAPAGI